MRKLGKLLWRSVSVFLLTAVTVSAVADVSVDLTELSQRYPAASIQFFPATEKAPSGWLVISMEDGVNLLDKNLHVRTHLKTKAEQLDVRLPRDNSAPIVFATLTESAQIPTLFALDIAAGTIAEIARLPATSFQIENICLQRDSERNVFLYLLDERGAAEHWLLTDARGNAQVRHMRDLPIPPNSKSCSVDDTNARLYIAEEGMGVWAYNASAEASPGRRAVAMAEPFGALTGGSEAVTAVPGGVLAVSAEDKKLHAYKASGKNFTDVSVTDLPSVKKPEGVTARFDERGNALNVFIYDDADGSYSSVQLPWHLPVSEHRVPDIVYVTAEVQTPPMSRFGDAADDPAIWINSRNPKRSLVLATNKKEGLFVYDMQGREVQSIASGNINNVDVRYGVKYGKQRVDLAIASLRDDNSLALYTINRKSGKVTVAGKIATDLEEIYGFCMYQPETESAGKNSFGEIYAIANDKSGEFQQFLISETDGKLTGKLVRRFHVSSQPEGCAANDATRQLFVGEEDVGVWVIGADADAGSDLKPVIKVGPWLHDDVEGMAVYHGKNQDYLVVSSQGNDSYLVLDAFAPYRPRGVFRVGINAAKNIDGSSETDGLDVTSTNLGGAFSEGMLVVQDGHKVMPETPQNFKYIAWKNIRAALGLE